MIPSSYYVIFGDVMEEIKENEEWRRLPEPYHKYDISSYGNCKNNATNKMLAKAYIGGGYVNYTLQIHKKSKHFFAHRLVAQTFLIATFQEKLVINHKNGIRDDNRVSNLECITQRENNLHKDGKNTGYRKNTQSNKLIGQFDLNDNFITTFKSIKEAARIIKDNAGSTNQSINSLISEVCSGKRRSAYGFKWKLINNQSIIDGEEWRLLNIVGGSIEVSSEGRMKQKYNRITHGAKNGYGYMRVSIFGKVYSIHRLVAQAFCEKPDGCDIVNHLDENRSNNKAENLEWTTRSGNAQHSSYKNEIAVISINKTSIQKIFHPSMISAAEILNIPKRRISTVCKKLLFSSYTGDYYFRYATPEEVAIKAPIELTTTSPANKLE